MNSNAGVLRARSRYDQVTYAPQVAPMYNPPASLFFDLLNSLNLYEV